MSESEKLYELLLDRGVRFLVIGVGAANYYAREAGELFATQDVDLFLAPEPPNVLTAWECFLELGWELSAGGEPLGSPVDLWLAERVVSHQAAVKAGRETERFDLTLVMTGFTFDEVWADRRHFEVEGVAIPVARLEHVIASKKKVGRPKDHLFLATHAEILRVLGAETEPEE